MANTWTAALQINGQVMNGIEMGDGFMDAIGAPAPKKDYITNSNELAHGVQYDDNDGVNFYPKLDERQLTLPFYISGATQQEYEANKAAFFAVLYRGSVTLSVPSRPDGNGNTIFYHLKYKSGVSYAETRNGCFSAFSAKFTEPDPTDRTAHTGTRNY